MNRYRQISTNIYKYHHKRINMNKYKLLHFLKLENWVSGCLPCLALPWHSLAGLGMPWLALPWPGQTWAWFALLCLDVAWYCLLCLGLTPYKKIRRVGSVAYTPWNLWNFYEDSMRILWENDNVQLISPHMNKYSQIWININKDQQI